MRFSFVLLGLLTVLASFQPNEVYAAHNCQHPAPEQLYGRNANCGYFLNNSWNGFAPYGGSGFGLLTGIADNLPGNFEALDGVTNVDQFVSVIRYHLQPGCNPGGGALDDRRRNAAAFIVLTMQGAPAGTAANAPCTSSAYSVNRWETIVRQYAAAGLVEWNPGNNVLNGWYTRNTRIQGGAPDPAWYVDPDCAAFGICAVPSIIFRAPNGASIYMIKKNCANPIGIPGQLSPLTHGFNATPNTNTTLQPNTEAPASATFSTGVSYQGAPFNAALSWRYFILRNGSSVEELMLSGNINGHFTGSSYNRPPVTLPLAGRNLQPGDRVCSRSRIEPAAGQADPAGNVMSVSLAFRETPNDCETIVQVPYHQVFGDTRAGSGFLNNAGSCAAATDTTARIIGFNRNGTPDYTGAGSQLAAYAFNSIVFFASGQLRPSFVTNPKPLSFANVNPSRNNFGTSTYGGGLMDGQAVCAPDYYDDGVADANQTLGASTGANIPADIYTRTGNLTITGGTLGLDSGSRVIYVNGDVTITGNITYAGGNYNNIDTIPGFRLIVEGNIYVEPGVTQLDGIYIAQPHADGTEGRFYTCAPGGAPPDAGEINGICRTNKLTIYGAVLADLIKLTRSGGTVSQSVNNPAHSPSQAGAATTAAEVIIMTPEAWLISDFTGDAEFDSVTTLPPVL